MLLPSIFTMIHYTVKQKGISPYTHDLLHEWLLDLYQVPFSVDLIFTLIAFDKWIAECKLYVDQTPNLLLDLEHEITLIDLSFTFSGAKNQAAYTTKSKTLELKVRPNYSFSYQALSNLGLPVCLFDELLKQTYSKELVSA